MARRQLIDVTPTLDTSAYGSGDHVGSIQTITGAGPAGFNAAVLESVTIIDKNAQGVALSILFFDSLPTIASADNAALDMTDANAAKCIGHVSIDTTDYVATASNTLGCKVVSPGLPLTPARTGVQETIYAVVKSGGTPTYSADGLTFRYCFRWDI
jgi:hypothetical protein